MTPRGYGRESGDGPGYMFVIFVSFADKCPEAGT